MILFLTQSTLAATSLTQPKTCLSISAVKAVGVNYAENTMAGQSAINFKNQYDTLEEWSFVILIGEAKDESDAIAKGNARITLLSVVDGPDQVV